MKPLIAFSIVLAVLTVLYLMAANDANRARELCESKLAGVVPSSTNEGPLHISNAESEIIFNASPASDQPHITISGDGDEHYTTVWYGNKGKELFTVVYDGRGQIWDIQYPPREEK